MAHVVLKDLSPSERYRLITGSVMPRPIALVTTIGPDGLVNAAPFSAFNYLSEDPPLCALGIERYGEESHRRGEIKDTLRNILAGGDFVVNMVDEALLRPMVASASDYPPGIGETEALGLDLAPSRVVGVPRLALAPIAWECRRYCTLDFSQRRSIVLGEILAMEFRPGLLDEERLRVEVDRYFPFGRLGGPLYASTLDRVEIRVPAWTAGKGDPRG
jgi:2-nitrobenzoate nitroreductase